MFFWKKPKAAPEVTPDPALVQAVREHDAAQAAQRAVAQEAAQREGLRSDAAEARRQANWQRAEHLAGELLSRPRPQLLALLAAVNEVRHAGHLKLGVQQYREPHQACWAAYLLSGPLTGDRSTAEVIWCSATATALHLAFPAPDRVLGLPVSAVWKDPRLATFREQVEAAGATFAGLELVWCKLDASAVLRVVRRAAGDGHDLDRLQTLFAEVLRLFEAFAAEHYISLEARPRPNRLLFERLNARAVWRPADAIDRAHEAAQGLPGA